jgi:hypothetical protein
MYKSVRTWQETYHAFIAKISQLMLLAKHSPFIVRNIWNTDTLCEQNAEF